MKEIKSNLNFNETNKKITVILHDDGTYTDVTNSKMISVENPFVVKDTKQILIDGKLYSPQEPKYFKPSSKLEKETIEKMAAQGDLRIDFINALRESLEEGLEGALAPKDNLASIFKESQNPTVQESLARGKRETTFKEALEEALAQEPRINGPQTEKRAIDTGEFGPRH